MTTRTPQAGDPFLLDGFEYVLGKAKKQLDSEGNPITLRAFHRPGQSELQAAAAVLYEAKQARKAAESPADIAAAESRLKTARAASEKLERADVAQAGNYSYKKDGVLVEADLVWTEVDQMRADLKDQANRLIRGNPKLAAWAEGASEVQDAALSKQSGGAWTMADRHLMKPPVQLRKIEVKQPDGSKKTDIREAVIVPQRAKEASEYATRILAHAFPYDVSKEG